MRLESICHIAITDFMSPPDKRDQRISQALDADPEMTILLLK
jgi:hypothetical protein